MKKGRKVSQYVNNCFFRKLPTLVREKEKAIIEHAQELRTRSGIYSRVLDIQKSGENKRENILLI